jgi:ABC-2 type transport system ATP-binding protein
MNMSIELSNVTKNYDNFLALKNINLNVYNGQIFAYMGPNGAGKTTTINLMLGLLKPNFGNVRILGEDPYLDNEDTYKVRNQIGFLLDSDSLNPKLTGFNNILY